jgi:putative tricarboxylic transport membrane protein
MVDVVMTFAFGMVGLLLNKYGFERPPLILAFVLGPLVEKAFRQSMIFSDGSFTIFVTRPISASFTLVTLVVLIAALIKKRAFVTKIEAEQ